MPNLYGLIERLAQDERANESTSKRVSCAIRVDDLLGVELLHWVDLHRRVGSGGSDDGGVGTAGDDDCARLRGVNLGKVRDRCGDLREVVLLCSG